MSIAKLILSIEYFLRCGIILAYRKETAVFKGFILIAVLFFCPGLCLAAEKSLTAGNMTIQGGQLDPYLWDFGSAKEGEILTHSFALKNKTEKTMNITETGASCGCTKPEVKKNKLKPGESTDVEVKFNTKGYSGPVQQFVYVHTDSLESPIIRLVVKANIQKKK